MSKDYVITGVLKDGKRFNPILTKTPQNYNIWKGTIWLIDRYHMKRRLVKRINN